MHHKSSSIIIICMHLNQKISLYKRGFNVPQSYFVLFQSKIFLFLHQLNKARNETKKCWHRNVNQKCISLADVSVDRPVAGDEDHCLLPLYAESSEHLTSSNLQKRNQEGVKPKTINKKRCWNSQQMTERQAFLTNELVPGPISLL